MKNSHISTALTREKLSAAFLQVFDSVAPYIFFLSVALVSLCFILALIFQNRTPDSKEVLFLNGDYEKAFKIWSRIANEGQEEAQMMVGMSNYVGLTSVADKDQALRWYKLAGDSGNEYAQFTVGRFYESLGNPHDDIEAFKWYEKAAKLGNSFAQHKIGTLLLHGKGVKQNNIKAHVWLNLASSKGSLKANSERKKLEKSLSDNELKLAREKAVKCLMTNYVTCP